MTDPTTDEKSETERDLRVWLDDMRPAPQGWLWVKTCNALVDVLKNRIESVAEVSLDHDLADEHYTMEAGSGYSGGDPYAGAREKTGYDACVWMAENNVWPPLIRIHSASSVGRQRMMGVIMRYKPDDTTLVMMPPGRGPDYAT